MHSQVRRIWFAAAAAVALPISTATNKPGKLIKVAGGAGLIVITP